MADRRQRVMREALAQQFLRMRRGSGTLLRPIFIRRSTQLLLDGLCGSAALLAGYAVRFDFGVPPWARPYMWAGAAAFFVLNPLAISSFGGYRSTWQFFSVRDLRTLAQRLALLNLILLLVEALLTPQSRMPFSVLLLGFLFSIAFSACVRLMRRIDHEALSRLAGKDRILIVGEANAIAGSIRQLLPLYGAAICGAITEDPRFHKVRIAGVPTLGSLEELSGTIHGKNINRLFICSADLPGLSRVMQTAGAFGVSVKFLPCVADVLDDRVRVSNKVDVARLRQEGGKLEPELHGRVLSCLDGKTVLITGAGGSIGSELVRQVRRSNAARVVLLDHDENAMYELLSELGIKAGMESVVADIRDRAALHALFVRVQPDVVLHAAAYKHVPMMEANPCQAILNNVVGTRTLAEVAMEFHTERLVMISSDKAVRPSSVMGASKRLAELEICRLAATPGCPTAFACVRFGNVLGSRGSVLPMFLKQIEAGGPITVTHEEMTRYFMTIPQAVSLVLQAATLASSGHIYMLDMGDPVKIVQFAREVIQQSGLMPGKDIEIKIVGTRPGEKLHEQLWAEDAHVSETEFEQIWQVRAVEPEPDYERKLSILEAAANSFQQNRVRSLLHELAIDFTGERPDAVAPQLAMAQ